MGMERKRCWGVPFAGISKKMQDNSDEYRYILKFNKY